MENVDVVKQNIVQRMFSGVTLGEILVIALAFLMPFSRAGVSLLTVMIIISWMVKAWPWQVTRIRAQPKAVLAMMGYVLFGVVSLLWSEDVLWGVDILGMYLYWLLIPAIAFLLRKEQVDRPLTAFLIAMAISQVLFWGVHFGLWSLKYGTTPSMKHIEYGVFLCVAVIASVVRSLSHGLSAKARLLYATYCLFTTSTLFTSTGLTGQVAFVATVPFLFLVYAPSTKRMAWRLIAILTLSIGFFLATYVSSSSFRSNVGELGQAFSVLSGERVDELMQSSVRQRTAMTIIGLEIFSEHPIVGTGFGDTMHDFQEILKSRHPEMAPLDFFRKSHLHNMYIEVTTRIGIVGFVLFAGVFYYLFTMQIDDRDVNKLRLLILVAYLAAFIGEPLWHKQFSMALFSLFTGLFMAASMRYAEESF